MSLTAGTILRIYNNDNNEANRAVVQVLDVKKINGNNGGGQQRYR